MIHIKDHKTRDMFNPFAHLGPKRVALLEKSWAHLFREEILHRLPVEKLFPFYNEQKGRRTKELFAMLGLLILQQMEDLTDEQTVSQFAFNMQWQYALNVSESQDAFAYVSPRTVWTLRDIVAKNDLQQALFENVTETLQRIFAVDASLQRLDSIHIFSNMRHLGRVRLFGATIKKFLVNLKRHHQDVFSQLGTDFTDRYLGKSSDAAFAAVKPSDSAKTLQELGEDLFLLVERYHGHKDVSSMSSYKLLVRLLAEQCLVEDASSGKTVMVKPNNKVASDSLQCPSDPDATYSGHKGQGYQMQVMECCSMSEDKGQLSLITYVKVEAANKNDVHAMLPALADAKGRNVGPTTVLADTQYGSDDNVETAKAEGVEVIAPAARNGREKAVVLADFELSDRGEVLRCPGGQVPLQITGNEDRRRAWFDRTICDACTKGADCPVTRQRRRCWMGYDKKSVRIARRRSYERTAEFREKYRFRAGVEATMSDLDRVTGIKHLRVRGIRAVTFAAILKSAGLNILRATAFRNRQNGPGTTTKGRKSVTESSYSRIKDLLKTVVTTFWQDLRRSQFLAGRCLALDA